MEGAKLQARKTPHDVPARRLAAGNLSPGNFRVLSISDALPTFLPRTFLA